MKNEFKLLRGYKLKFNFVLPPPIRRMLDDRERMFLPLREIENLQDEYLNLYRERQLSNEGRYDEVLGQQRRELREMRQRMREIDLMYQSLEAIQLQPNE
jgi:hypothetical protein